jgi:hypothetical protein
MAWCSVRGSTGTTLPFTTQKDRDLANESSSLPYTVTLRSTVILHSDSFITYLKYGHVSQMKEKSQIHKPRTHYVLVVITPRSVVRRVLSCPVQSISFKFESAEMHLMHLKTDNDCVHSVLVMLHMVKCCQANRMLIAVVVWLTVGKRSDGSPGGYNTNSSVSSTMTCSKYI